MLVIREQVLGPEHLQTGYAIGVLAGITADLGNRAAGIDLRRRSIAIIEKVSGPANLSVLIRYESIALIQLALGQRNEALTTLRTRSPSLRSRLPPLRPAGTERPRAGA